MAIKYTHEELVFLRDSPLCTKPENLPPAEEWMGPPVEQQLARAQHQQNRNVHGAHNGAFVMGHFEQSRGDKTLLDQTNRRPDMNRHASRNSATNPEDIVFGPPRMQFTSAGRKGGDNDRSGDGEHQSRLNNFRTRTGDGDGERFREGRNANPLRRRDGDQDNEGWSTVKPRKSFGAEGAERFQGRVGMSREDKRHSRETDRPARGFDSFNRDNEEEGRPRNGLRHKTEGSEGRIGGEKRERMDRAKSWRDKAEVETEDHPLNRYGNNNNNRHWGRDGRAEREPEWLDEPAEPKAEVRTQKDFQKWMEEMKKSSGGGAPSSTSKPTAVSMPEAAPEGAKAPLRSPPADSGMDKFFAAFGAPPAASAPAEENKAKSGGKSSRFTSFFANQDTPKNDTTPKPPPAQAPAAPAPNSLLGALMAAPSGPQATQDEKQAFQNIIAKLKVQSMSATPPGSTPFAAPPNQQEGQQRTGPSPFQHEQDGQAGRPPPQHSQEIHAPRPQQQTARPDQLMQDLLGHHQRVSSQSSARNDGNPPNPSRSNSNTEFLMNLMRSSDAQRSDSAMMRAAQQAQKQGVMPSQPQEREGEFADEGRNQPRMRGPPPGFGVNDAFRGEPDFGRGQPPPPHILQRPQGPPGLDQLPPGFMGGHMPPPQQQGQQPPRGGPMLPPPGLQGGRGLPPGMFPPGAPPPGPHMHPDMGNMPGPPRNMGMPPPGFFNGGPPPPGGPHGFMPPGMGGFNGPPGPDSPFSPGPHSGGPHSGGPFERGMPGTRGGNFGRG